MAIQGARAAALAVLAAAALAGPAAAQRVERFSVGDRAAVYNLAGRVVVEPGSGGDISVEVTRGGREGGRLRITRGTAQGGLELLRVIYPENRIVYPAMGRGSRSQLSVRRDGTFGSGLGTRRVMISGSGSGLEAHADIRVRVPAGRRITIHQGVGRVEVSNVNGTIDVNTSAAAVRASGTRGALSVDVGSGGVEVMDAEGRIDIDTGSGAVRASRVRGSGLAIDTGSGSVTASDVRVETMDVDVGSGSVNLSGISARDLSADTGSGSIAIGLVADARNVAIDTGSGGVTLTLPSGFGADLQIETGSGGITVDVPVTGRQSRRGFFRGRVGDGNGRVEIDTGSGGVRVRRG